MNKIDMYLKALNKKGKRKEDNDYDDGDDEDDDEDDEWIYLRYLGFN